MTTRDEIMAMDEDALRLVVAAALGKRAERHHFFGNHLVEYLPNGEMRPIPDYPRDIAAAYELEDALPEEKRHAYTWELLQVVSTAERDTFEVSRWQLVHASAADRCRAWLMTMGEG